MIIEQIEEIQKLDARKKLILLGELWASIINDTTLPITEEEKKLLDKRYSNFKKNPEQGTAWNKIYKELTSNS